MSKYDALWRWIRENGTESFALTFEEIERIAGVPIDHSFLTYKKELESFGYEAQRISLKQKTVRFHRIQQAQMNGECRDRRSGEEEMRR